MAPSRSPLPITIVSGLPRSGTSMMMCILEAGGLEILTDHIRAANIDNPNGYYELERVKQLANGDACWLSAAQGKVIKIISPLLRYLPTDQVYRIVFMRRKMAEILASQRQMLIHRKENVENINDEQLAKIFEEDLNQVDNWIKSQPHVSAVMIDYNALLFNPTPYVTKISKFINDNLDLKAMACVIDMKLYRQRR